MRNDRADEIVAEPRFTPEQIDDSFTHDRPQPQTRELNQWNDFDDLNDNPPSFIPKKSKREIF
jgi:hypothetical protein